MWVSVLHEYIHTMGIQMPAETRSIGSPVTGVVGGCEPPVGNQAWGCLRTGHTLH